MSDFLQYKLKFIFINSSKKAMHEYFSNW